MTNLSQVLGARAKQEPLVHQFEQGQEDIDFSKNVLSIVSIRSLFEVSFNFIADHS